MYQQSDEYIRDTTRGTHVESIKDRSLTYKYIYK